MFGRKNHDKKIVLQKHVGRIELPPRRFVKSWACGGKGRDCIMDEKRALSVVPYV